MDDYHSILFKAVSGLEPNTASARHRLYERARSAISAKMEGASPPFKASDIAAAKHGLRSAIERIEAQALPAWLQQERAECGNDCGATTDILPDEGAYRFLDASEIAAAERGLERAIEEIEAVPDRAWQAQGANTANGCPATVALLPEIERAWPDGSEVARTMERLESAIAKIKAEAISALPQQPESAMCANNPSEADVPAEIEEACQAFVASEIAVAAECGLESAIERTEAVPDWLRQPERVVRAEDCPATAAHQNEGSPGTIKKLWTRLTGWSPGRQSASPGRDTGLGDLLLCASDEADGDQDFAPKRARTQ